jgi:hypothetical protein
MAPICSSRVSCVAVDHVPADTHALSVLLGLQIPLSNNHGWSSTRNVRSTRTWTFSSSPRSAELVTSRDGSVQLSSLSDSNWARTAALTTSEDLIVFEIVTNESLFRRSTDASVDGEEYQDYDSTGMKDRRCIPLRSINILWVMIQVAT